MRPTVLVIEDDNDVRQLLVEVLTDEGGFTVHAADSIGGAQTVMTGYAEDFSLVVLDVGLPDGDGRDFCASLRRQGFRSPVILLTGLAHEDDVVRGLGAGADDYLAKPFSIRELLARVTAQLRHVSPEHDNQDNRLHGMH